MTAAGGRLARKSASEVPVGAVASIEPTNGVAVSLRKATAVITTRERSRDREDARFRFISNNHKVK